MPKILISDKYDKLGLDLITGHNGFDVDIKVGLKPEELKAIIGNYDALLVRSNTKPDKNILDAATNLKLIIRAGEGVDNIDCKYAAEKGIIVENTPGQNSHAVAELAIGLMFSMARHIPRANSTTKAGQWEKKNLEGTELKGKTLGLLGCGKIGRIVGAIAKALSMNVIYYDVVAVDAGFAKVSLDEVLAKSDYISIHVPLNDKTRNLVGPAQLAKMKPTAYILNCARGGIIDEPALVEALNAGKLAGAAIDCYAKEPPPTDNPLLKCEKIICIPHLGASSKEAQINCSTAAAEQLIAYFDQNKVMHKVN